MNNRFTRNWFFWHLINSFEQTKTLIALALDQNPWLFYREMIKMQFDSTTNIVENKIKQVTNLAYCVLMVICCVRWCVFISWKACLLSNLKVLFEGNLKVTFPTTWNIAFSLNYWMYYIRLTYIYRYIYILYIVKYNIKMVLDLKTISAMYVLMFR